MIKIRLKHTVKRILDNPDKIYVEYHIENEEIQDICYHGQELDIIDENITETIDKYEPIAFDEILSAVNGIFPDIYY